MVAAETLEGIIDRCQWFHYDIANDVLYLRLASHRQSETVVEETPDGLLILRTIDTDQAVGMTNVNRWKRFGSGSLPDSIDRLGELIEPWARRIAA